MDRNPAVAAKAATEGHAMKARSGSAPTTGNDAMRAVAAVLRSAQRVLITGHADPDGDVAGTCSALFCALRRMGKQPVLFNPDPFPVGYRHLPGAEALVHRLHPEDVFDATVVLDAANPEKVESFLPRPVSRRGKTLWVDHHPRRGIGGDIEWIDEQAASAGEMLYALLGALDVEISPDIGMGVYATLIADTGGFRYESTTGRALRLAADLVERGVRPWNVAEQVYERQPVERVRLLSRVLSTLQVGRSGLFASVTLAQRDLAETLASPAMSDGMINHARGIDGVEMAAQLEELGGDRWRITLRSRGGMHASDVATLLGERGHRFGASFIQHGTREALLERLERAVDQVAAGSGGSSPGLQRPV